MASIQLQREFIILGWNIIKSQSPSLAKTISSTVIDNASHNKFQELTKKVAEVLKATPLAAKVNPEKFKEFCGSIVYWRSKTHPVFTKILQAIVNDLVVRSRL